MSKFLNISTDTTLGGNSPSDETVSSQKAIKDYVDNHGGSASADGVTINTNSSDELQAIGVINKNSAVGATNPKYDWVGTLAEYNSQSVATNHPDWICYITDDVSGGTSVYTKAETDSAISTAISTMLDSVFPVGTIYKGTMATCPLASLISGSTWTLVASDRVLQGSSSNHTAGTTIAAGLPNITGSSAWACNGFCDRSYSSQGSTYNNSSGALYATKDGGAYALIGANGPDLGSANTKVNIDASRSNSIYGNSTTVQPPAYVVNIWERTA